MLFFVLIQFNMLYLFILWLLSHNLTTIQIKMSHKLSHTSTIQLSFCFKIYVLCLLFFRFVLITILAELIFNGYLFNSILHKFFYFLYLIMSLNIQNLYHASAKWLEQF